MHWYTWPWEVVGSIWNSIPMDNAIYHLPSPSLPFPPFFSLPFFPYFPPSPLPLSLPPSLLSLPPSLPPTIPPPLPPSATRRTCQARIIHRRFVSTVGPEAYFSFCVTSFVSSLAVYYCFFVQSTGNRE